MKLLVKKIIFLSIVFAFISSEIAFSVEPTKVATGITVSQTKTLTTPFFDNNSLWNKLTIDGKNRFILIGSSLLTTENCFNFPWQASVLRYSPEGKLDNSFANNGVFKLPIADRSNFYQVLISSRNEYILGGIAYTYSNNSSQADCPGVEANLPFTIKLNKNGEQDMSFGNSGILYGVTFSQIRNDVLYSVGKSRIAAYTTSGKILDTFGNSGVVNLEKSLINYPQLLFQGESIYSVGSFFITDPIFKLVVGVTEVKNGVETDRFKGLNNYAYTSGFKDTTLAPPIFVNDNFYVITSVLTSIGPPNIRNAMIFSLNRNGKLNTEFGIEGYFSSLLPKSGLIYGLGVFTNIGNRQLLYASYDGDSIVFQTININQNDSQQSTKIGSIYKDNLSFISQIDANHFLVYSPTNPIDSFSSEINTAIVTID